MTRKKSEEAEPGIVEPPVRHAPQDCPDRKGVPEPAVAEAAGLPHCPYCEPYPILPFPARPAEDVAEVVIRVVQEGPEKGKVLVGVRRADGTPRPRLVLHETERAVGDAAAALLAAVRCVPGECGCHALRGLAAGDHPALVSGHHPLCYKVRP